MTVVAACLLEPVREDDAPPGNIQNGWAWYTGIGPVPPTAGVSPERAAFHFPNGTTGRTSLQPVLDSVGAGRVRTKESPRHE
jgi:hypothetical protein